MTRFVTFSFDDGMMTGALTASALLAPDRGTFFVVSDWASGLVEHEHPLLKGRDFGSMEAWRSFSELGQDVQLHSATHPNLRHLSPSAATQEVEASLTFTRKIHEGPYIFCCPFNIMPDEIDFRAMGISAVGFASATSDNSIIFNKLDELDLVKDCLKRWAVRERHLTQIETALTCVPDDSWLILGLHSLDGEGWEPWSSTGFRELVRLVRQAEFQIITACGMVSQLSQG